MAEPLLSVRNLTTAFFTETGLLRAVDDVSFDVQAGQTLAVVGESGCGKSVTALSIMRLIPDPPGQIESGKILLQGRDLLELPEREMRAVRGTQISIVFQEPSSALSSAHTVGSQIAHAIRIHRKVGRRAVRERAIELLKLVGVPSPADGLDAYPHQLSSGMRHRVMLAMALSCEPKLLIADEPTAGLDVTTQAQILDLLRRLQAGLGMSIVFITHDLGLVAEFASEVLVMYAARVVETGPMQRILTDPLHPYTRGLLASVPQPGGSHAAGRPHRLTTIDGVEPELTQLPPGCRFADRCGRPPPRPEGYERCSSQEPELRALADGRSSRCYFSELEHGGRAA